MSRDKMHTLRKRFVTSANIRWNRDRTNDFFVPIIDVYFRMMQIFDSNSTRQIRYYVSMLF